MVDFQTISDLIDQYQPSGTTVTGGNIRAGDFFLPGQTGVVPGIGVGNVLNKIYDITFDQFLNMDTFTGNQITIPANSTVYFDLKNFVSPLNPIENTYFANMKSDIDGTNFLRLKTASRLFFNFDSGGIGLNPYSVNMTISFRDYYGEKGTIYTAGFGATAESPINVYNTPRAVYDIYSMKFVNTGVDPIQVVIGILPAIELYYYDLGEISNHLTFSLAPITDTAAINENVSGDTNFYNFQGYYVVGDPFFGASPAYESILAPKSLLNPGITANTGTVRTILDFTQSYAVVIGNLAPTISTEVWKLNFGQNVFGYGRSLPNYFIERNTPTNPEDPEISSYFNNQSVVQGAKQFSENWSAGQ